MSRPIITCAGCGRQRPHKAHGWCTGCYMRWDRAGRPDTGPPAPNTSEPSPCAGCGRDRPIAANGWCGACYMRWTRAGKPVDGPPPPRPAATGPCSACGKECDHLVNGWCRPCYLRWYRAGRPDTGPPPRSTLDPSRTEFEYRLGEYAFLLSCGESRELVAERLGISLITARNYDKALAGQRAEHYQEAA